MKVSPATVLFAGLFVMAAVVAGGLGVSRGRLADEVRALREERDRLRRTAEQKVSLVAGTELDRSGPRGLMPEGLPPGGEAPEAGPAEEAFAQGMAEGFAEMMRDPAAREAIRAQMRAGIDFQYRDLFELLELEPATQAAVARLLADRQERQMDLGMRLVDRQADPEGAKAVREELEAFRQETEEKLKDLLGQERFDQLDRFEKSQPEREQLRAFRSGLDDAGLSLDETTESKLMDLMYQERTEFEWENNLYDSDSTDLDRFRPEAVSRFLEQNRELQAKVLARAAEVLTPEQLEVFRKGQEQQNALTEMNIRMASRMIRQSGDRSPEPAPAPAQRQDF